MSQILSGKEVAKSITEQLKNEADILIAKGVKPTLAIIRVGQNPSDIAYENSVIKKAQSIGVAIVHFQHDDDVCEEDIVDTIHKVNKDQSIHGALMFRPLPKHLDDNKIRNELDPAKDLDCITDRSLLGVFIDRESCFAPCTAESALEILKYYDVPIEGKSAVVVGRSLVIGKPVAMMLLKEGASVTICHSKTPPEKLEEYCKNSDIIVAAVGRKNTINSKHVSGKQTIIDVGINFTEQGDMVGDVDFAAVENAVNRITPVPGGVGAVTTTLLMKHLIMSAKK